MTLPVSASAVLDVWFEGTSGTDVGSAMNRWFQKDEAFDATLRARFGDSLELASRGELGAWCISPRGSLAFVILCDQFARNVYRGTARSFAFDPLALFVSSSTRARGEDESLTVPERVFLAMPLMHSESIAVHDEARVAFTAIVEHAERNVPSLVSYAKYTLEFEEKHRAILERFGRYPHRNALLGRTSTSEEVAFLATPGSSF
jgi:uncharacterized protein (DUF924 family)